MRALQGLRGFWISQLRKLNWMLVLSKLQWSVQGNVDFSGMFRGLDSVSSMDRSVQSLSSPYTIDVELPLSLPPIPLKKRPSEPVSSFGQASGPFNNEGMWNKAWFNNQGTSVTKGP